MSSPSKKQANKAQAQAAHAPAPTPAPAPAPVADADDGDEGKDEGMAVPSEVADEAANDAATMEEGGGEEGETAELVRYGFDLLANIKAAQLQNGLRHGDYQRYRSYCSRRLRRLRVGLGFTNHKRDFKLKNDMTQETQRKRFHLLKRLNKAAAWASQLETLCASRADTRTQLQAEAYSAWLSGSILFERNMHEKALAKFLHAKEVYEKLAAVGGSTIQILCEERVANLQDSIRFSTYMLRNKAGGASATASVDDDMSEMGGGGNELLAAKLEELRKEKLLAQAQSLDTVQWQGKTIPVSHEKLRLSFVEANNLRKQLDKALEAQSASASSGVSASAVPAEESKKSSGRAGAAAAAPAAAVSDEPSKLSVLYQKLFAAYDDALKVLRDALLEPKMLEAHKNHLLALREYSTAQRLEIQIIRNKNFVHALEESLRNQEARPKDFVNRRKNKPDEAVVLYEKLIASYTELNEMASANKNASQSRVLAAQNAAASALRLFYLAESYRRIKKFVESFLLYERCMQLVDEFTKAAAKLQKGEESAALAADVQRVSGALKKECMEARGIVHACALLEEAEKVARESAAEAKAAAKQAASEGGDKDKKGAAPAAAAASAAAASAAPAPQKPILFDLAFNDIAYPDVAGRLKRMHQAEASLKKALQADNEKAKPAAAAAATPAKAAPAPAPAPASAKNPASAPPAAAAAVASPASKAAPAAMATKASPAPAAAAAASKATPPKKAPEPKKPEPEPEPEEEEEEAEEEEEEEEESPAPVKPAVKASPAKTALAPAPAAAKPASAKPAAKPAPAPEPEEEEEEEEAFPALSAAPAPSKKQPPPSAGAGAKKTHAPPGESKADKARREKSEKEEEEKKAAAAAEAAKKKGWGIGGLLGKMIGR